MRPETYTTPSGIVVERTRSKVLYQKDGLEAMLGKLDRQRGIYLSSGYEFPGRYSRWDIASVAPALELSAQDREVTFAPLNSRGEAINGMLEHVLAPHPHWDAFRNDGGTLRGTLKPLPALFPEEERSKQPSVFSMLRALIAEFKNPLAQQLALIGPFGYDLLFRFDPIKLRLPRTEVKDLRLFLCDDIYFMDRMKEQIERFQYDFTLGEVTTRGLKRSAAKVKAPKKIADGPIVSDHEPEEYMANVETVREGMRRGDYYEVVLRQTFSAPYSGSPAELFNRIRVASPSPYQFLLQFGDEQLIGASPEMFVRVEGKRVRSCPISGTTRRTGDAMRDADNIKELLNSLKEESELTMCTDVDRNDKSRVCAPGSVRVLDRRLIESYAGVFHTVDHVEGMLGDGFDALDAFLTHMWAVTMIGAPKKWAAQAVEDLEKDARGWYAGAIGMICLDGDINTGITIRTIFLKDSIARYSAGATLLYDSVPEAEELESRLKATAFRRALRAEPAPVLDYLPRPEDGNGVKLLLVDNEDCFIHTLANYVRQTGASVMTYRAGVPHELIEKLAPSLILVSPGPGRPSDFGVPELIRYAAQREIPVFGVCLGLQGMVEAFGGELGVLDYPMHGKPSTVRHLGEGVFEGLPPAFRVGRYHSLYAVREKLPSCLEVTAETEDGVIMGIRHRELPMEAVQFHPESILTLDGQCGLKLMENVVKVLGHSRVRV
jgi:anthranilate synthase